MQLNVIVIVAPFANGPKGIPLSNCAKGNPAGYALPMQVRGAAQIVELGLELADLAAFASLADDKAKQQSFKGHPDQS